MQRTGVGEAGSHAAVSRLAPTRSCQRPDLACRVVLSGAVVVLAPALQHTCRCFKQVGFSVRVVDTPERTLLA